MRGYFGVGVEGISKAMNLGAVLRTAHGFGASFGFTIAAAYDRSRGSLADTSDAIASLPFYDFATPADLLLPRDCALVGVELIDEAVVLPSFHHPRAAAYVLGGERSSLSPELVARCDHLVRIPTRFCLNLSVAGAIVMYDRLLSLARFAGRPLMPGGPPEPLPLPVFGGPRWRRKEKRA